MGDLKFDIDHFGINVIDTPGFGDTNSSDRQLNAQKISHTLVNGVNAFIYVVGYDKSTIVLDKQMQENLGMLHRATRGALWKNLIFIIKGIRLIYRFLNVAIKRKRCKFIGLFKMITFR